MLATMQRMLQQLAHRGDASAQAKVMAKPASMRRRCAWAQALQQLVDRASRSRSGSQFPHPESEAPLLLSPNVVRACCPELLAVEEALLDTRRPISAAAVQQLKTFLNHPGASRLFGADPVIARRAARHLQRRFAEHPEP
jgi:hypothetical protein